MITRCASKYLKLFNHVKKIVPVLCKIIIINVVFKPRFCQLQCILLFQGTKVDLLLYIADNLAHFPYSVHEEPLFVIYHIDTILSVTGANLLHSFKEVYLYMYTINNFYTCILL